MNVKLALQKADGTEETLSVPQGTALADILRSAVPGFSMPCGGNHKCGKCLVTMAGGDSAGPEELHLLGEERAAAGQRLACFVKLNENARVRLSAQVNSDVLSTYRTAAFTASSEGVGLACDIGTTTVALQLIDLATGKVLAERTAENAQRPYGADVISRIEACSREGVDTLSALIRNQLETMARECMAEADIKRLDSAVVTGNSTMLHLFEGLDPAGLAVAPFTPVSRFGCLSRHLLCGAPVYLPRCISAYVGADILCSALAASLSGDGVQLLADIGTNGEIVLCNENQMTCCAAAAGPAFEGAGLSCGMRAAPGAICKVLATNPVTFETVGGAAPKGICGSGILNALDVMLKREIMDESGYLEEPWLIGDSGVRITPRDVRQIQLAKSAVCAAILTLLEEADLPAEKVSRFVIAGGFGSAIDLNSAAEIGLFPAALVPSADYIGNGALGGAVMLLCDPALRAKSEAMADGAREISLTMSPSFADYYIDCMEFGRF